MLRNGRRVRTLAGTGEHSLMQPSPSWLVAWGRRFQATPARARGDSLVLGPQKSQVRNAALLKREALTLSLDHAFSFELADVGVAATEVPRQRRRADGCRLSGSRSRGRLGDGRAGDH
jgi:hypothetical protein